MHRFLHLHRLFHSFCGRIDYRAAFRTVDCCRYFRPSITLMGDASDAVHNSQSWYGTLRKLFLAARHTRAFIQASFSTTSKAYLPIGAASSETCKSYRRQRDNNHYYIPLPAIARSDWRHWYCHIVVWHGDIQRYACLGWEHIYNSPSYITRMIRK